jgi:hypothetical protein
MLLTATAVFGLLVLSTMAIYRFAAAEEIPHGRRLAQALGILITSVIALGATLSTMTCLRGQEIFASMAAFGAIVVMFVSNFSVS